MCCHVLHRASSPDDDPDGFEDDLEVQGETPVLDVVGVEFDDFFEVLDL